ncbi:hypothetical protein [Rhodanobacter glycinis]|nr:hypothetical protein [Rhodanobacter glycinis]
MDMSLPSLSMPHAATGFTSSPRFGWRARLVIATLAMTLVLGAAWLATPLPSTANGSAANGHTFAHWRGEGRDWLLMAKPDTGELVVYDAADGRPLRRLRVAGVKDIVLEDNWLFVTSTAHPGLRLLHLPQLSWRPLPGTTEAR